MSRRSDRAMGMAIAVLAATIYFSAAARAADPNAPRSQEVKVPGATKSSSSKPTAPAKPTPASFTSEMPFSEAVDILRNCTTPPLNIVVLWKEIGENAGVYRETPIGISGVAGLRVGQYLELLLLSLSGSASAKLGYTVKDGVITVGTTGSLRAPRKVTRVYDISDLVAEPARYPFLPMGFGGMYGGSMVGPAGGYGGGYGAGPVPGTSYTPTGSRGDRGLANSIGSLYRGSRSSGPRRR
jgi:hypothetical protein